jgi:hypothetical protein
VSQPPDEGVADRLETLLYVAAVVAGRRDHQPVDAEVGVAARGAALRPATPWSDPCCSGLARPHVSEAAVTIVVEAAVTIVVFDDLSELFALRRLRVHLTVT